MSESFIVGLILGRSVALTCLQDGNYQGQNAVYANLIYLSIRLLRQHGIGDAPPEPINTGLYQRLGLDALKCEEAIPLLVSSADVLSIADQMVH